MLHGKFVVSIGVFDIAKQVSALHVPFHCGLLPETNAPWFVFIDAFAVVHDAKNKKRTNGSKLCSLRVQFDRSRDILRESKLAMVIRVLEV